VTLSNVPRTRARGAAALFACLIAFTAVASAQSFSPAQSIALSAKPGGIIVGDFNHDGLPDVGVLTPSTGTLTWVTNGSTPGTAGLRGSLRSHGILLTPLTPVGIGPVPIDADFDETPFGDVFVITFSNGVELIYPVIDYLPPFGMPVLGTPIAVTVGFGSNFVMGGDIYGDGTFSTLTSNFTTDNLTVNWGVPGSLSFRPPVNISVGFDPRGFAVGNFFGGGKTDIAIASSCSMADATGCTSRAGNLYLLQGITAGFIPRLELDAVRPRIIAVGTNPSAVLSGDFNGDGKADIAVANQDDSTVTVLLGNGDGTFKPGVTYKTGLTPGAMAVGDVNSDGILDLVTANQGTNDVSVLIGNGDGTFKAAVNFAVGKTPIAVKLADFNNDGQVDIITANSGSNDLSVLANTTIAGGVIPQTGWWWDPKLNGTGFFVEPIGKSGKGMFLGAFLYDAAGKSTWLVSTGPKTANSYSNVWLKVSGGQSLTGPYQAPTSQVPSGNVTLAFSDASHAVLTRPDGTNVNLQRFSFSKTAVPWAPQKPLPPQNGWWWGGASLSGTGFGIEIQGTSVFIVAYVYDSSGNPVWYLSTGAMSTIKSFIGSWDLYSGGPQLTSPEGTYSATKSSTGSVPMTLTFTDDMHGTLTMGTTVIPIVRFREY